MTPRRTAALAIAAMTLTVRVPSAQAPARPGTGRFVLSLESISRLPEKWMGTPPSAVQWSEDGRSLYFQWNPELKDRSELYTIPAAGGEPVKVAEEQRRFVPSAAPERNKAGTLTAYEKFGDIFVVDVRSGKTRRVTDTDAAERAPRFTFDQQAITFEREQNLFAWTIETGELRQVTNFKTGKDPDAKPDHTKMQAHLEKQQLDLFEYLKKTEREEQERKAREKTERGPRPEPTYLKDTERVSDLRLSPDGTLVTFILADRGEAERAKVVEMPKYVTKSGYVEMQKLAGPESGTGGGRTKVGDPVIRYKLGTVSVATGAITWADHGRGDRAVSFNAPVWSDDGRRMFAWVGSLDQKDVWLLLVDPKTGKTTELAHDRDEAWVLGFRDGRVGFASEEFFTGWMPDHESIWFTSERSGYRHLYTVPADGGEARPLTSGRFEIFKPKLVKEGSRWFFVSSEVHPGERHLYTMPPAGGQATRLTTTPGWHDYFLSPDERQIALLHATPTSPAELYVMPAPAEGSAGAAPTRLTRSTTEEFRSYPWRAAEIVTFKDADGFDIYADLWKPKTPHPLRPAVVHVHGAGYAQAVFRRWSNTAMFFHYLTEQGYTVLSIDYRGSAGYGRDCRTAIYRSMGDKDVASSLAAADYLVKQHKIDPRRIGIYGGSYGGFYTLMALFKHPGVFAAGAALYPVTDWAHYNHGYTSRILNLAFEDEESYRRSSPIYFADGLRDELLILHGVQDNNVHFQDTVRLVQRLIELRKTGWDLAIYPVEPHGWQQETSRLDANRRIVDLFERVLKAPKPGAQTSTEGR